MQSGILSTESFKADASDKIGSPTAEMFSHGLVASTIVYKCNLRFMMWIVDFPLIWPLWAKTAAVANPSRKFSILTELKSMFCTNVIWEPLSYA